MLESDTLQEMKPLFTKKKEKKNKLHKILITVLIPLIFGILLTTLLSVLIILILSPYWASVGGHNIVEQQYVFQTSVATIFGNSQQQIFQKVSTIRSQVLISFWNNEEKIITVPTYNIQQPTSQMNHYNSITQICSYCLGWAIIENSQYQTVYQLNGNQQQFLDQVSNSYTIMQALYLSNQDFLVYFYFHSIYSVYVQYPIISNQTYYSNTPLLEMQNQYSPQNLSTLYKWQIIGKEQIESCVSLIDSNDVMIGVFCMGLQTLGEQVFLNNMMETLQFPGSLFTFLTTPGLNIFATTILDMYPKQVEILSYGYPNLYSLLFNASDYNYSFQFDALFSKILYPQGKSDFILLYSADFTPIQNQENSIIFKEIIQQESGLYQNRQNGNDYIYMQLSNLMVTFNSDYFQSYLEYLSNQIQNNTFLNIMTIAIPIACFMCLMAWGISYRIIQSLSKPLGDLKHKLDLIKDDSLAIQIYSNFQQSSSEVNSLYDSLHQFVTVLNFSNDKYFEGDDTSLLIKYAQGQLLFHKMKSNKGMGMILNNIGNIHRRQKRFIEAIQSYRESLTHCEDDIRNLFGEAKLLGTIKINLSDVEMRKSASFISLQRNPEKENIRKQYEDIYSNRNFSLASTLIEYAESTEQRIDDREKDTLYKESVERLKITLALDMKELRNEYRQIQSRILMCKVLLNLGELDQALNEIEKAEQLCDEYELGYQVEELQVSDSYTIPPGILRQRILYEKGLICLKYGKIKNAALIFTDCLETSKFYDPDIRQNCLLQLKELFVSQSLLSKIPRINDLLQQNQRKKNKDIVFCIDYSGSMENIKKELAIKGILKIFDNYLQDLDRIGFLRFNQNIEVIFDLTQKTENTPYLRSAIEKSLNTTAIGKTALLQSILHSYSILERAVQQDNSKWIVALCDGEDNLSNITYEQMKKYTQNRRDVSLIVIGIGLTAECLNELFDLCRLTRNGFLIQSVFSEDLDVAFQSLSNLIFGNTTIYDERLN